MNGRHARKLRKLSEFIPSKKRHYQQFNNSNKNCFINEKGNLEKGPGTIIEVTEKGGASTSRAKYKYMKEEYYGTF